MAIPAVVAHGGAGPGPERNENVEIAVNEVSPRSTQSIERATMSPMINALTVDSTCTW